MTNIRKSFLNKNLLDDLMDGSFWFGKNENKAEHRVIKPVYLREEKTSFLDMGKEKLSKEIGEIKIGEIFVENESVEDDIKYFKNSFSNTPVGYIKLFMVNINPNELFVNHNITMQHLTINGNKFIKELRLTNQGRELDCYSEGENKSLTIEKISTTQLLLTLEENNGNLEKFIIINGAII